MGKLYPDETHPCPQCGDETPGVDGWCPRCSAADLKAWQAQILRLEAALRQEPLPPTAEAIQ